MKLRIKFFILLVSIFFLAVEFVTAQVEFVSEGQGSVTLRTAGTAKRKEKIMSEAEKNAFFYVLFRGVPGSTLSKTALIEMSEGEAKQKFKSYFDEFYAGRYMSFVTSVLPTTGVIKGKHRNKTEFAEVTINFEALRNDLERNNIVRKFGF